MSSLTKNCYYLSLLSAILASGIFCMNTNAAPRTTIVETPAPKNTRFVYAPISIPAGGEVKDTLSDRDIPTGDGGFARDYSIQLKAGDQIAIELTSETFDAVVTLLNSEGKTIGKNDDGPDGSSNSLLFTRIKDTGNYVIRVQGFGETSSGAFKLKVSKLKAQ
jgi:Bacterial pre-peptidase C-terminal domain